MKFLVEIDTLRHLFHHIFDTISSISSMWRKTIFCPILKDPLLDKFAQMN